MPLTGKWICPRMHHLPVWVTVSKPACPSWESGPWTPQPPALCGCLHRERLKTDTSLFFPTQSNRKFKQHITKDTRANVLFFTLSSVICCENMTLNCVCNTRISLYCKIKSEQPLSKGDIKTVTQIVVYQFFLLST